ncbi:hypothetical protein GCM10027032_28870 [Simplicispira piscis]
MQVPLTVTEAKGTSFDCSSTKWASPREGLAAKTGEAKAAARDRVRALFMDSGEDVEEQGRACLGIVPRHHGEIAKGLRRVG